MSWSFLPVAASAVASTNVIWFDVAKALLTLAAGVALCALAILAAPALVALMSPKIVWPARPRKRRELRLRTWFLAQRSPRLQLVRRRGA